MKNGLFALFISLVTLSASSARALIICNQNTRLSPDISQGKARAILTPLSYFQHSLTVSRKNSQGQNKILLQTQVYGTQDWDVIAFENKPEHILFKIQLNEEDQAFLKTPELDIHFFCTMSL